MTPEGTTPPIVIERLVQSPTYVDFLSNHLIRNIPVLIGQDLTESWPAFQLWGNAGDIYWDYLINNYGSQTVSVTNCRAPPTDSCVEDTTLGEVIRGWLSAEHDTAKKDQPLLYVKDWHLARWVSHNHAIQPFYTTPHLFADDWLNYHYCTFTDDDFRFVYLGVRGTSTLFHKDVYDSYSWSTNVIGRKLWTFWTPNDEARKQPGIELVQETGETVFVPSGWYHTVENLTNCISINHNWCNSVNLPSMYAAICCRIVDVERELEDVRELLSSNAENKEWEVEWMNIVQDVLEKDAGWNWSTFWHMVLHGLEGSIKAHSSLLAGGGTSDPHSVFPFAPRNLQPPLIFIIRNVRHCIESFHRRQRDESKYEFHLKVRHKAPGEYYMETVRAVFDRICEILEGCDAGTSKRFQ